MKTRVSLFFGLVLSFFLPIVGQAQSLEWQKLYAEANTLYQAGQLDKAVAAAKKALDVAEKEAFSPFVAASLNKLVLLYSVKGQYAQAEPLAQRSYALLEKLLGPQSPVV